jgi:hypothetical protein
MLEFPEGEAPTLRPLMYLTATVQSELAIHRCGADANARLSVCYFTGGAFHGPRVSGTVLPGGGDWADCKSADHVEIDVRALLRTADEALIYLCYQGIWRTPPGVLARVIRRGGEREFRASENYFRTTARFETDDARYTWLNHVIAIGLGVRTAGGVGHRFYELL